MLLKLMCPCCKTYNFAVSPDLKPQEFILVICKQCSANLVKYWDGSIIIISDTMLNQLDKMIFDKQIEKIEKIEEKKVTKKSTVRKKRIKKKEKDVITADDILDLHKALDRALCIDDFLKMI